MADDLAARHPQDYLRRELFLEAADSVDVASAGGQRQFGHADLLVFGDRFEQLLVGSHHRGRTVGHRGVPQVDFAADNDPQRVAVASVLGP